MDRHHARRTRRGKATHTRRRAPHLAWLLAAFAFLAWGCDDSTETTPGDGTQADGELDGTDPDGAALPDGAMPCLGMAGGDADMDGLPNGVEDSNLNCVVDPGETDWQSADTDMDGISDGDEDLNGNGQWDPGEFDPRKEDTDDNGIPDSQEPLAQVCLASLIKEAKTGPAASTETLLAIASDDFAVAPRGDGIATFSVDDTTFGFVALRRGAATDIREANANSVLALAMGGFPPVVELQEQPFATWSAPSLSAREAIRTRLNLGNAGADLATLADQLAEAHHGAALDPTTDASSRVCPDEVVLWQTTVLRNDGNAVVVGAITCRSEMDGAGGFLVDDLTNTSNFALATPELSFLPDRPRCEDQRAIAEPQDADFIWVIDNSGSMIDEQIAVAAAADLFFQTLLDSGTEWRLGVTTTETWGLDQPAETPDANFTNHTPGYDDATGLRGGGFVTPDTPGGLATFKSLVTEDVQCTRDGFSGANICGSGFESGLSSGITVIDRLTADAREEFVLRDDATTAVIWLSDEEDQIFKEELSFDPWPADDARRAAPLMAMTNAYLERGVFACAIVGDAGLANGGACDPLDPAISTQLGAQRGQGYVEVAEATGGVSASICNSDLSATIDACVRSILQFQNRYELEGQPLSSTIKVSVDGVAIPRDANAGWTYEASSKSIALFGVPLGQGSSVAISYREWVESEK